MKEPYRLGTTRAFSVLELLVVVAITAILLVLLFSTINSLISAAKSAACVSNMQEIGVALISYASDNKGYLPKTAYVDSNNRVTQYWTTTIIPYLGISNPNLQVGQTIFRCPARPAWDPSHGQNYTYGLNYGKASGMDTLYLENIRIQNLQAMGPTVYIMTDALGTDQPLVLWPGPNGYWPLSIDANLDGIPDTTPGQEGNYNLIDFIHRNGTTANFLFADGSVQALTIRQWSLDEGGLWGSPWPE